MEQIVMLEAMFGLATAAGLVGFPAVRRQTAGRPLADRIDALLPQTQCGQCGYPGCRPYAEAIAGGEADINQCPPGGEAGIRALADLLGREPEPLDRENGVAKSEETVARIDETRCIGCVKCVRACPVDAILGAAKQMHTVIGSECTGCELCIDPCPVDCIDMVTLGEDPALQPWAHIPADPRSPLDTGLPRPVLWAQEQKRARMALARQRYERRQRRLEHEAGNRQARRERHKASVAGDPDDREAKKARIAAALAKVRAKKARQASQSGGKGPGR